MPSGSSSASGVAGGEPAAKKMRTAVPHLPATSLARVLDYMEYTDVRRALLAGKCFAFEAAKHVRTLSIMLSSELDVPAARRFADVKEVNILCLIAFTDPRRSYNHSLSVDAALGAVPFLSAFPRLEKVFFGCFEPINDPRILHKRHYVHYHCRTPDDHRTYILGLVTGLCGAIKARLLSKHLTSIAGLELYYLILACRDTEENPDRPCDMCRRICTYFPLQHVLDSGHGFCLNDIDRYTIIRTRPGGGDCLRFGGPNILLHAIINGIVPFCVNEDTAEGKKLQKRILAQNIGPKFLVQHLSPRSVEEIQRLVDFGCFNPLDVPKERLYDSLGLGPGFGRRNDVWSKTSVDFLVSCGFHLDRKDIFIVDEQNELSLQAIYEWNSSSEEESESES